ncbi:MAG: NUDIX domain-containing protein [Candidatus Daviesbacteria bacterium]|nr:MAG: NUDIX domain-containing protein [Candidatus Daviesbacteria bacterium]
MAKVIRVVGAVIFNPKSDSYFVGQRGKNKKVPLKWEFIGGKVETGEDLLRAIQREFKEEVGINIKALRSINKSQFNYGGEVGLIEVNFIECELFKDEPNFDPEVYEICKWVKRGELANLDWVEADREFALNLAKNEVKY